MHQKATNYCTSEVVKEHRSAREGLLLVINQKGDVQLQSRAVREERLGDTKRTALDLHVQSGQLLGGVAEGGGDGGRAGREGQIGGGVEVLQEQSEGAARHSAD